MLEINLDIVVPAIHKDCHRIRQELHDALGYEGTEQPEEMNAFVRKTLRKDFLEADIGISGCNFAVAETGSYVWLLMKEICV